MGVYADPARSRRVGAVHERHFGDLTSAMPDEALLRVVRDWLLVAGPYTLAELDALHLGVVSENSMNPDTGTG